MPVIDLAFELRGQSIPIDYGYALFGAISRIVAGIHGDAAVGVHPIRGIRREPRRLTLVPQSKLRIRLPSESIAPYLALGESTLDLDGSRVQVRYPRVEELRAAPTLVSRLVTIGHHEEPEAFLESIRRQLAGMGVAAEPSFLPSPDPARAGTPSRRVIRIKGKAIVGYPIAVAGLTAAESLIAQENGLGSRRRMGCGVLVPAPGGTAR